MTQRNGLAPGFRLNSRRAYSDVFRSGHRRSDRSFILLVKPNGMEICRLGMAIAKKQVRRAVQRNRIKRIIRESFRHNKEHLQGLDIVVMVRAGAELQSNQVLTQLLENHWRRLSQCKTS